MDGTSLTSWWVASKGGELMENFLAFLDHSEIRDHQKINYTLKGLEIFI